MRRRYAPCVSLRSMDDLAAVRPVALCWWGWHWMLAATGSCILVFFGFAKQASF